MREQTAGGHIFNMDGAGADGGATPRFAAYGATKRSLAQLSKSLQVVGDPLRHQSCSEGTCRCHCQRCTGAQAQLVLLAEREQ